MLSLRVIDMVEGTALLVNTITTIDGALRGEQPTPLLLYQLWM